MPDLNTLKRQVVHTVQRFVANPVGRRMPVDHAGDDGPQER